MTFPTNTNQVANNSNPDQEDPRRDIVTDIPVQIRLHSGSYRCFQQLTRRKNLNPMKEPPPPVPKPSASSSANPDNVLPLPLLPLPFSPFTHGRNSRRNNHNPDIDTQMQQQMQQQMNQQNSRPQMLQN
ncbi:hypothetical protein K440DRAFT_645278 [Wilcoxina mikolae CBS 423.85]|nr:hypothetical protein K440DRAFT_645278 [Wilcoxina mikolae CBS 423.85]